MGAVCGLLALLPHWLVRKLPAAKAGRQLQKAEWCRLQACTYMLLRVTGAGHHQQVPTKGHGVENNWRQERPLLGDQVGGHGSSICGLALHHGICQGGELLQAG